MRAIIYILSLTMFVSFIVSYSQVPETRITDSSRETTNMDYKIKKLANELNEEVEYIQSVTDNNKKRLSVIKNLDRQEEVLFNKIFKKLRGKKNTAREVVKVLEAKPQQTKATTTIVPQKVVKVVKVVKVDTVCVEYDRNFFGIKKCTEFKTVVKEIN